MASLLVKEVACRFGAPVLIQYDQGRNSYSALFTEMCQLLGIKKTRTSTYHPQSDDMVERLNPTPEDQLAKFVDYHQKDWDEHIYFLLMAYRSAVHESTCCTTAKMMFGRNLRLPIDLLLGQPVEKALFSAKEYPTECMRNWSVSITLPAITTRWVQTRGSRGTTYWLRRSNRLKLVMLCGCITPRGKND